MSYSSKPTTKIGDDCKTTMNMNINDNSENICVVCFKNVEIYSIGECDHPVCYECSTRMRVLCEQNECPICRQSLSKVIFTNEKQSYRELEKHNRSEYYNKKYKISFANLQIQKAFYDLLDHPCPKCESKSFYSFNALKEHVRKEHELFYCDLCVTHLKIFTFERKCYTRQELALHRRKGDPDNTSHRGHPLCQYCDLRYLDRDELFRHLRREHFFCHFCDVDGSNQFYADYEALRQHFRTEHYLCEEGDCASEQFTAAFRTEIDLKAHIANVHSKTLGKQQAKQARTLQLEITLGPRSGRSTGNGASGNIYESQTPSIIRSHRNDERSYNNRSETSSRPMINQNQPKIIDASNDQEFPSLGGASGTTSSATGVTLIHPNMSIRARAFGPANIIKRDEFPALGSSGSGNTIGDGGGNYDTGPNLSQNSKYSNNLPVSAIIKSKKSQQHQQQAGGGSMVIHVSNRPNVNTSSNTNFNSNNSKTISSSSTEKKFPSSQNDFPALPGSSTNNSIPSNLMNSSVISSKHRSLINDYVSVAHPASSSKISLVPKEALTMVASSLSSKKSNISDSMNNTNFVPCLTKNDFPALSGSNHQSTSSSVLSWTKSQKMQDHENRKSKIAPAPILNNGFQSTSKKQHQQSDNNNNKKDKKSSSLSSVSSLNSANNKSNEKTTNKKTSENFLSTAACAGGGKSSNKNKKLENNNENKVVNKNINKKDKSSLSKVTTVENFNDKRGCDGGGDADNQLQQQLNNDSTIQNSKPPPGFDRISSNNDNDNFDSISSSIKNKNPPPGFKTVTLNSVAKSPNSLTFTTSLGEIFSIVPNHQYIPPPNSTKRNKELVTHFQNTLSSIEAFEEFKHISQKFREGQYKALPYYEHCQAALKDKFDELFSELLVLLPDINKQQELYLVHCQHTKDGSVKENKKNQKKLQFKLEVCSTCKQVLKSSDKQAHIKAHTLENNFPALNGNTANGITSNPIKNKK